MINDFIDTVFKRIVALNSLYDLNSIPHSDTFFRDTEFLFGLSTYELDMIIKILNESHKIFIMEISREEYDNKKEKIYGYVDANSLNIEKLQSVFHRGLMYEYERVYNNRKGVNQIIKELMPNLKSISNSIMGNLLNKVVMLDSYLYFLQKNPKEYTEEWKNEHLKQQISLYESIFKKNSDKDKNSSKNDSKDGDAARPIRAIDSPFMEDFTELVTKGAIARVLQIYGVVFFFRVHLRKCKFSYLSQVIDTGIIDRKNDLLAIREMLTKVKENIHKDKELEKYLDDIMSLDIKISRNISSSKK